MTALPKPELPDSLRNEMARLYRAGLTLLPLGGGSDGKSPLMSNWAKGKPNLGQVFGPMYRTGSRVYGIRLDALLVVDFDTDDPALVAAIEARFGRSPVHVKTPRGWHLFYSAGDFVPNLKAEELPVDVKTGPRAYVVGPLSERPDGGLYAPTKGRLGDDGLPCLRAPERPLAASPALPVGERHNQLVKKAMKMVELVDSQAELVSNLVAVRDDLCADPATMPDSEVRGIAEWAWRCRLESRVFAGRNSMVRVDRLALDILRRMPNSSDALGLYVTLLDAHGHIHGKRFALDWRAMKTAGLTDLSERKFRAARRTLQKCGLLIQVGKHLAGSRPQEFMLRRPLFG